MVKVDRYEGFLFNDIRIQILYIIEMNIPKIQVYREF